MESKEKPMNVMVFLKDGSVHKFGNIKVKDNGFLIKDQIGGEIYYITSQFNETYIFPMNSINYIKKWLPKEEDDGK